MAKLNPLDGKMRGKLGGRVYSLRSGETIVRELNPAPFNPSTAAQVQARAKLKLLSQLSAVCAAVIAIPREGNKSPRNLFTKVNYPIVAFSSENATEKATIDLNAVQLTRSVVGLPALACSMASSNLTLALPSTAGTGIDQMLYAIFQKGPDGALRYVTSRLVTTPGSNNTFSTTVDMVNTVMNLVILGYGIRFNSEDARAKFNSMQTPSAETFAQLVVSRILSPTDVTLTETNGQTINAGA